jgi:RNA polymerase sigma-32 factor
MSGDSEGSIASGKLRHSLTEQEEAQLTRRWQVNDDRAAAELLARIHWGQVVAQAQRYRHQGVQLCDLVGEGNVGLMVALGKFEPERGVRFGAYASYWIKAFIAGCVSRRRGLRTGTFFKLRRERARVTNELGWNENAERVLAQRVNLPLERVREHLQRLDLTFISFDSDLHPGSSERAADTCDQEHELARFQGAQQLRRRVALALASLDPRERYIAEKRLMEDEQDKPTLAQLAQHFKISRERVGRIEARTKRKLRERISREMIRVDDASAASVRG